MAAASGTFWRGLAGVLLVMLGYLVMAFIIELLTGLANYVSNGWPESWSRYFGAVAGAIIGTGGGKLFAQAVLKSYPRRGVSLGFIFLNVWLIVGDALYPGPTTALQIVRAIVTIAATLAMIWPGDKVSSGPRVGPQS